jgi:hypothetical protein
MSEERGRSTLTQAARLDRGIAVPCFEPSLNRLRQTKSEVHLWGTSAFYILVRRCTRWNLVDTISSSNG